MWFPNRSDANWPVQSQKMARSLKFWISVERNCTIHVANTKALITFAITAKLICAFVFSYADCLVSHGVAKMHKCTTILSIFIHRLTGF